jgi:hypothetical protein
MSTSSIFSEVLNDTAASDEYVRGLLEGLAVAARLADSHAELQQTYADECGAEMPRSEQAFLMQKVVARQMGDKIRKLIELRSPVSIHSPVVGATGRDPTTTAPNR